MRIPVNLATEPFRRDRPILVVSGLCAVLLVGLLGLQVFLILSERDRAVDDLIALVAAVDGILHAQSKSDASYFIRNVGRTISAEDASQIEATVLAAYRWQYIISGVQHQHFGRLLTSMTTPTQMTRIQAALAPIMAN